MYFYLKNHFLSVLLFSICFLYFSCESEPLVGLNDLTDNELKQKSFSIDQSLSETIQGEKNKKLNSPRLYAGILDDGNSAMALMNIQVDILGLHDFCISQTVEKFKLVIKTITDLTTEDINEYNIAKESLEITLLKGMNLNYDEIEIFNRQLGKDNPYVLIGPGRWGTADPWLGIPVNWKQISNARIIIEIGLDEMNPDPSFGSHFFQNVTSLRIGYFTIQRSNVNSNIDLDWLHDQPIKQSSKYVRWYQLNEPLVTHINGSTGEGNIFKPKEKGLDTMDEEESSGI